VVDPGVAPAFVVVTGASPGIEAIGASLPILELAFIAVGLVNLITLHARFGSAMRGEDLLRGHAQSVS